MDTGGIKIYKRNESNFHICQRKMELVLMFRGVKITITTRNYFHFGKEVYDDRTPVDKFTHVVVAPPFPDNILKHTSDAILDIVVSDESSNIL